MTKERTFDFLGITAFHKAGYTGKNVRIMSDEKIIKDFQTNERWAKVISPVGYDTDESHGSSVMYILQEICPDATYYAYPFNYTGSANNAKSKCADYIKEHKIHLFTTSCLSAKMSKAKENLMQECIDVGCTFFAAAGNSYGDPINSEAISDKYITVGAVYQNKNEWIREVWASTGKELDYVEPSIYMTGTSFTVPIMCAMCGLAQDFFISNAGRSLNREELIKFIDDNVLDVGKKGFDTDTGNGMFVLPEPSTIDIAKYIPEYKGDVNMKIQDKFLTPSKYTRPQTKITPTATAWHYVGNPNTSAIANWNYFESLKNGVKDSNGKYIYASSQYLIGLDGEILHLIPDDEKSFCTNQANDYAISVECCHINKAGEYTKATYRSMVWLGAYLMRKHGYKNNIRHYDVTGKECPKWFVDHPDEWEKFKKEMEEEVMLQDIMEKLGITEEELKQALIEVVSNKLDKNKRPDWLSDELYESIKNKGISDMTRLNDTATRIEVATMVYNATK